MFQTLTVDDPRFDEDFLHTGKMDMTGKLRFSRQTFLKRMQVQCSRRLIIYPIRPCSFPAKDDTQERLILGKSDVLETS